MRSRSFVFLMLLALVVQGCGGRLPYHQQRGSLPTGPICRVAVLPFSNESDYPVGDVVAYKVFVAEFNSSGRYLLAQEGDILRMYQQLRIFPGQVPTTEQLAILGNRLGAQLLITGRVTEMRENPAEASTVNPALALTLQLRDGRTGDPLWTTYHRREGTEYRKAMHFGTIHTVTGLAQQVAREVVQLWFKQGLTTCDVSPRL
ncbi:MAG: hypothetical protein HY900_09850 [Deltaproteobacteria bacterium]|nr:hypothetical protein [Deltaproteobacteria bacterium]